MYVANVNPKTKKQLKEMVAAGRKIPIYQPGPFGGNEKHPGKFCVEGPKYPAPHAWYATVTTDADGYILTVK